MELIESHQRLINSAVSAAFDDWRSQLRDKFEDHHKLRREIEKSIESQSSQGKATEGAALIGNGLSVQRDQESRIGRSSDSTCPRCRDLENEKDDLFLENKRKDKLIAALRFKLTEEKEKSKAWNKHFASSPGPTPQATEENIVPRPCSGQGFDVEFARPVLDKCQTVSSFPPRPFYQDASTSIWTFPSPQIDTALQQAVHSPELPSIIKRVTPTCSLLGRLNRASEKRAQILSDQIPSELTAPLTKTDTKTEPTDSVMSPHPSFDSPEVAQARAAKHKLLSSDRQEGIQMRDGIFKNSKNEESLGARATIHTPVSPAEKQERSGATNSFVSLKWDKSQRNQSPPVNVSSDESKRIAGGTFPNLTHGGPVSGSNKPVTNTASYGIKRSCPLQELTGNESIVMRTSNIALPPSKKQRSNTGRRAGAICTLAEDGEDYGRIHKNDRSEQSTSSQSNIGAHQRLQDLLAKPSPPKIALARLPSKMTSLMDSYLFDATVTADQTTSDELRALRASQNKDWEWYESAQALLRSIGFPCLALPTKKQAHPLPRGPNPTAAQNEVQCRAFPPAKRHEFINPDEEEPLRARPLHRLSLSDFKINISANGGLDYAYSDVVRNHEQRKCLPGCTRPDCCGDKFRVLTSVLPRLPRTNNSAKPQPSDDDILASFLGLATSAETVSEKIRSLTPLARQNLLVEAKTKLAADAYGKWHRNAFSRLPSPPGFWRTDMPGTQEYEEDVGEAKRREREEVERRRREAMRDDGQGRWVFADEI